MIKLGELEDKVMALEEEIEELKREVEVLKRALRDRIARYEVSMVKQGRDIRSIVE
jgi:cell division protein FtsB